MMKADPNEAIKAFGSAMLGEIDGPPNSNLGHLCEVHPGRGRVVRLMADKGWSRRFAEPIPLPKREHGNESSTRATGRTGRLEDTRRFRRD
jgi:hypothetical protein